MMNISAVAFILFTVVYIFLLPSSFGQYIEPHLCDGVCYCSRNEAVVDCSPQDRIIGVPTNLPPGTQKLVIQGGFFPDPGHLSAKNLTGLAHLVSLRIVNSQLRSVQSRAFLGMTNLRDLDLSLNLLYRIEPHTFYGLNLQTLYLQKQRLQPDSHILYGPSADPEPLVISTEAFYGLSAARIDLRRNFISDISYSLFSKVDGLEELILSNNRIRQLDAKFADYFDNPNRLIDLTDNPLECSCKLAWLVSRVKEWVSKSPSLKTACIIDPRISGSLSKVELKELTTDHLCMGSRIQSIGVDITPAGKAATLSCTAITFNPMDTAEQQLSTFRHGESESLINHPVVQLRPPSVAWKYVESGQLRQVTGMPSDLPQSLDHPNFGAGTEEKTMTTVQLNVSLSQIGRKFSCITWDEKANDQEVLVTIRGPMLPPLIKPKGSSKESTFGAANEKTSQLDERAREGDLASLTDNMAYGHSSFLFQKQYTLLEMIGAVIGTFLVTLVVLLVGSRCMMLLKHRAIFNHPSKEIGGRPATYDAPASKQTDALVGVGNITTRTAGSNSNGGLQSMGCDGIAAAYPLYNHYLASASGVTYPTHIPPTASLITSPTSAQLMPISAATPLLQPSMTVPGMQSIQPISQWPAPPGSSYSGAGSHEYDIPRAMELSQVASDQTTLQREHQQSQQQQMQTMAIAPINGLSSTGRVFTESFQFSPFVFPSGSASCRPEDRHEAPIPLSLLSLPPIVVVGHCCVQFYFPVCQPTFPPYLSTLYSMQSRQLATVRCLSFFSLLHSLPFPFHMHASLSLFLTH
uniref:Slit 1 protein n=1 Tax=Echinococcus granulosus TaxID=6210 RepID=A0A068WE41_ECHGR|nr:slit 1 protein [Echinococcus granulosus]